MRLNIMVGGPAALIPFGQVQARKKEKWLGVDIGATRLLKAGIIPTVAIGDFDSTSKQQFERVKNSVDHIQLFPPAKDFTDTQLGVKNAIELYHPDEIAIFGATGGRLDQYLSNLFLPLEKDFKDYLEKIQLIDKQNYVNYYLPGEHTIMSVRGFKYLAFVNLTPVSGLTLIDEKYPLTNWNSTIPFCWSSNEFTGEENHFKFDSGIVAVIKSRDLVVK
ncbi:MAG: thiamine diphosphokinase [Limosilactobacillus sp.]|uniref:thiamine diphosphokinase n=1 Tax=Limosilactobacillus sp. TaxID=2773925 RepID=UPI0025C5F612|nr:thiamine diphosphokinase [Limosilactobacillus sp.]MCI1975333.1 thiamine diphosphokinase [Limosilactobacillus sp.]MCI2031044.1 thiamine diphosphokinase [Limosilactobacillus sp.]